MSIKKIMLFAFIGLFLVACDKRAAMQKEIEKIQTELLANITNLDKDKAQLLIKKSQAYALAYPKDSSAARVLFKAADVARGIGDYPNAMKMWNEVQANFPQNKYASESLFLQGFTFENDLGDKEKAKECYLKFINLYPKHELADDANMALQKIDIPLEELIKTFEAKNKAEIEAE
jgi:tetratricopeptide (TPR) repeat protein